MTPNSGRESLARPDETVVCVVPAHNEESTVGQVVRSLRTAVRKVFVIDDGSTDATASRARQAGAEVLSHDRNRGVGVALQTGYNAAISEGADLLIQLDADGQHDPHDIEILCDELDESTDIVIGSRFVKGTPHGYSLTRRAGIWFFSFLCSVLGGTRIFDVTSGFRVYRVSALTKLNPVRSRHWAVEQTLMALRLNLIIKEVQLEIPPRVTGASQFNPFTAALYPLRVLAGMLGAIRKTSRMRE